MNGTNNNIVLVLLNKRQLSSLKKILLDTCYHNDILDTTTCILVDSRGQDFFTVLVLIVAAVACAKGNFIQKICSTGTKGLTPVS